MTPPTMQSPHDYSIIDSIFIEMDTRVTLLIKEAYSQVDRFMANPLKQLNDFADSLTNEVQFVDREKGDPILEQAPFVPADNDRDQLKAIFKLEVTKQKNYIVDKLKLAHDHCRNQLGHRLTHPDIPTNENAHDEPRAAIRSLAQQRQTYYRKFTKLVKQFINETNRNLRLLKAKLIEDKNLIMKPDTRTLNPKEFDDFVESVETKTTMAKSNERFSEALDQMFKEMTALLCDRIDNDQQFLIVRN